MSTTMSRPARPWAAPRTLLIFLTVALALAIVATVAVLIGRSDAVDPVAPARVGLIQLEEDPCYHASPGTAC